MPPQTRIMDPIQVQIRNGNERSPVTASRQVPVSRKASISRYQIKCKASLGPLRQLTVFLLISCTLSTLISTLVYTQEQPVPQANQTELVNKQPELTKESDTIKSLDDSVSESNKSDSLLNNKMSELENDLPTTSGLLDGNSIELGKLEDEGNMVPTTLRPPMMKYRRQAVADWWTKLSSTDSKSKGESVKRLDKKPNKKPVELAKTYPSATSLSVYKEQPLNQNAILTIRNQLEAIRARHKTLVTKSIYQLYQLDNKLVDSYKLCLKKKMPLYAGMLYRTRDFVVRMGKDVTNERKVLEGMTKQIQTVLKQKMTNRTLVREYRKLVAAEKSASQPKPQDLNVKQVNLIEQQSYKVVSKLAPSRVRKDSPNFQTSSEDVQTTEFERNPTTLIPSGVKGASRADKKISKYYGKKGNPHKTSSNELESKIVDTKVSDCSQGEHSAGSRLKKVKPTKYTIHVNEANLKKELNKAQELINRINSSTFELNSVVDDIVTLFKLNEAATRKASKAKSKTDKAQQEGMMMDINMTQESKKMIKKIFKSPARLYYEKYGKMTMTGFYDMNKSASDTIALPDLKPMFNSSSFVYPDMLDLNLGFEHSLEETDKELEQ